MLDLPFPPRRSHIRAFWWTLIFFLALLLALLARLIELPGVIITGGLVIAVVAVSGVIWERIPAFCYRLWFHANKRFALGAQLYVAALIHFLVFSSAPKAQIELKLNDTQGSMWRPYPIRSPESARAHEGWVGQFLENTRMPERRWWLFLLPLLLMLALFRAGQASDVMPENIYTLF
jgi:hypothetical protein